MSDIENFYQYQLLASGFQEEPPNDSYSSIGKFFRLSKEFGEGVYWVYGKKDLYAIKIHDFYFYEDLFFNFEMPECLNISYYESISGEEITPYRRLTSGCVKSLIGGHKPYKAIFDKNIPIRVIGIEILPAYYEKYLKETYPDEYISPHEAFRNIDQTNHFPEMISLLRQVWDYHGNGIAAKLFYEGKVAETISLVFEYNKSRKSTESVRISVKDIKLLENVTAYINNHFNREVSLEHLSHIACMGTTKLKSSFRQVYECTITEYIRQRRLSHAETLLSSTDFTIKQIAKSVGYSNPGRFASTFRKSTGLFPAEYRKMAEKKSYESKQNEG